MIHMAAVHGLLLFPIARRVKLGHPEVLLRHREASCIVDDKIMVVAVARKKERRKEHECSALSHWQGAQALGPINDVNGVTVTFAALTTVTHGVMPFNAGLSRGSGLMSQRNLCRERD